MTLAERIDALDGLDMQTFSDVRDAVWPYSFGCAESILLARQEFDCFLFNGAFLDAAKTLAQGRRIILNIAEDGITTALVDGTQGCANDPALALAAAAIRARG
jgi:hypothetical protein